MTCSRPDNWRLLIDARKSSRGFLLWSVSRKPGSGVNPFSAFSCVPQSPAIVEIA